MLLVDIFQHPTLRLHQHLESWRIYMWIEYGDHQEKNIRVYRNLHHQGLLHWELHAGNVWIKNDQLKLAGSGLGRVAWNHERKNKSSSYAYTQNYGQYISQLEICRPYLAPEAWRGLAHHGAETAKVLNDISRAPFF